MTKEKNVGFLIKKINEKIAKSVNQELMQYDLTLAQGWILGFLHHRKGVKTSQKDIEHYLEVSHPTVTGILKRLESKGFIVSSYDDDDGRVKHIYTTDKEDTLHKKMVKHYEQLNKVLMKDISKEEQCLLKNLLSVIYKNLCGD